jgi:hypothetical protein
LTPAASAKCASNRESDEEELRIPYANELCTDGPVHKLPEFHKTLRACVRQLDKGEEELDQAIEVYKNPSCRTPMKDSKSPTKKPNKPSNSPSELPSGKKPDAALTQYKESENSGTFRKEALDNVLLQYSEDVAGELSSSITKSKNKKARFEVLAQYTYSEDEEEDMKPPAKKPKTRSLLKTRLRRMISLRTRRRRIQSSASLSAFVVMTTLTQFWPDDKKA